jgi:hypothetical protein
MSKSEGKFMSFWRNRKKLGCGQETEPLGRGWCFRFCVTLRVGSVGKNAGVWTILEMLFIEALKANRLLIGHDQQIAEMLEVSDAISNG